MIINIESVLAEARAAKAKLSENYLSLQFSIHLFKTTENVAWTAYTEVVGHTQESQTPEAALLQLTTPPSDPAKLIEEATQLEAQAARLRLRAGGVQ